MLYVGLAEVEGAAVVLEFNGIALHVVGHEKITFVDVDSRMAHAQLTGVGVIHHLKSLLGVHHRVGKATQRVLYRLHVLHPLDQLIVNLYPVGQANAVPPAGKTGDREGIPLYARGQSGYGLYFFGEDGGEDDHLCGSLGRNNTVQADTNGIGGSGYGLYGCSGHGFVRPFS